MSRQRQSRREPARPDAERGFTLVETLVSLTLLLDRLGRRDGGHAAVLQDAEPRSSTGRRCTTACAAPPSCSSRRSGQAGSVTLPASRHAHAGGDGRRDRQPGRRQLTSEHVRRRETGRRRGRRPRRRSRSRRSAPSPRTVHRQLRADARTARDAPVTVRGGFATGVVPCVKRRPPARGPPVGSRDLRERLDRLPAEALRRHQRRRAAWCTSSTQCDIDAGILYRNVIDGAVTAAPRRRSPRRGPPRSCWTTSPTRTSGPRALLHLPAADRRPATPSSSTWRSR